MMPILVRSDDVRRERKAKVRHGRHRRQWVKVLKETQKQPFVKVFGKTSRNNHFDKPCGHRINMKFRSLPLDWELTMPECT